MTGKKSFLTPSPVFGKGKYINVDMNGMISGGIIIREDGRFTYSKIFYKKHSVGR